jgi:pimeloyl-CoA synthetase
MLVKVNNIEGNNVRVTKLDIDDFGSVIPLKELNLRLPQEDESVGQTLRHSLYAILFTADDSEVDGSTIILARIMTTEELNEEKERTVRAVQDKTEDNK